MLSIAGDARDGTAAVHGGDGVGKTDAREDVPHDVEATGAMAADAAETQTKTQASGQCVPKRGTDRKATSNAMIESPCSRTILTG